MPGTNPSDTFETPELTSAPADAASAEVHAEPESEAASVGAAAAPPAAAAAPPPLKRRLADAFREGVASARTDRVREAPAASRPADSTARRYADGRQMLDWAFEQGRSAAGVVRESAAVAVNYAGQIAGNTPAASMRVARALREGAASVRRQGGAEWKLRTPQLSGEGASAVVNATVAGASQLGATARQLFVDVVSAVKPGAERTATRGIRIAKLRIATLYTEIGREAVEAWGDGPVVTEKLGSLLHELRQNEEEVQRFNALIEADRAERAAAAARPRPSTRAASPKVDEAESKPAERADVPSIDAASAGADEAESPRHTLAELQDAESAPEPAVVAAVAPSAEAESLVVIAAPVQADVVPDQVAAVPDEAPSQEQVERVEAVGKAEEPAVASVADAAEVAVADVPSGPGPEAASVEAAVDEATDAPAVEHEARPTRKKKHSR